MLVCDHKDQCFKGIAMDTRFLCVFVSVCLEMCAIIFLELYIASFGNGLLLVIFKRSMLYSLSMIQQF